jgi:hypothetical protein
VTWVLIGCTALIILLAWARNVRYWLWMRSIKDPEKRMQAEILYRSWRRSKRR